MSAMSALRSAAATLVLGASVACAANPRAGVGVVYVGNRPPVARVEVISVRPGPAHVWIGGYWAWSARDYVWVPGRWEVPRAGFRRWESGHWEHGRRGWFWVDGRWR